MRSSREIAVRFALLALAVGGCDWREFDQIQDHTPVLAVAAPSHFGANDFGRAVQPVSTLPAGALGARYVVSGQGDTALAIVDIDETGAASSQNVTSPVFSMSPPITALAEVPGTNQVLLGSPGSAAAAGSVAVLTMGTTNEVVPFEAISTADRFGLGVAAGTLTTSGPDFVVASQTDLTVFLGGDPAMGVLADPGTCPIAIPPAPSLPSRDQLRRPIVVAALGLNPALNVIVLGTPSADAAGAVDLFKVDPTTGAATCAFSLSNGDHRFGQSLAVGDFDADGLPDLLVGSPPRAFWIKGPLLPTSAVLPVALAGPSGELGATVAAADVDGKPGDEALVGNPDATVGDDLLAGEVRVVAGAALDEELAPLRRHNAVGTDAFGVDLAVLPFSCKGGCGAAKAPSVPLALVGSNAHAFTYFKLLPGSADPRTP